VVVCPALLRVAMGTENEAIKKEGIPSLLSNNNKTKSINFQNNQKILDDSQAFLFHDQIEWCPSDEPPQKLIVYSSILVSHGSPIASLLKLLYSLSWFSI
jgi:hypothetical protein